MICLYAFITEPQSCQVDSLTDSKNYPFSLLCYQSSNVYFHVIFTPFHLVISCSLCSSCLRIFPFILYVANAYRAKFIYQDIFMLLLMNAKHNSYTLKILLIMFGFQLQLWFSSKPLKGLRSFELTFLKIIAKSSVDTLVRWHEYLCPPNYVVTHIFYLQLKIESWFSWSFFKIVLLAWVWKTLHERLVRTLLFGVVSF